LVASVFDFLPAQDLPALGRLPARVGATHLIRRLEARKEVLTLAPAAVMYLPEGASNRAE
jgi:hypothetical protein